MRLNREGYPLPKARAKVKGPQVYGPQVKYVRIKGLKIPPLDPDPYTVEKG
jgi:hypothetical protein